MTIGPKVGRTRAAELVKKAVAAAQQSGATLTDAVAAIPELSSLLSAADVAGLAVPDTYLGSADRFRQRLLASAADPFTPGKR